MRILAIACFYPPYHAGGYELRCKDVLDLLSQRGNEIKIITSRPPKEAGTNPKGERNIYRQFHILDSAYSVPKRLLRDYLDAKFLHRVVRSFQPNLVYLWNVVNFTRAIFPYLAERDIPVVYDEGANGLMNCWGHGGSWFSYLERESPSAYKNTLKRIIGVLVQMISGGLIKNRWDWPGGIQVYFNGELNYKNAIDGGVPVDDAPIVHSGVDIHQFAYKARDKITPPLRIIVPGRIEARKGQADAVMLLMCLREKNIRANLTIVGKNNSDSYYHEINKLIDAFDLVEQVEILPMIDLIELANLYQRSDICFFSSLATTGFSRIPLEAMACGCLVISYGNEGSDEIIGNDKTGFIVPEGDYDVIASVIQEAISNPEKYRQIINKARRMVERNYSMDGYVDKIEAILFDAITKST